MCMYLMRNMLLKNFRTYKLDYLEPVVLLGKSGDILDKIDKVEKNIVEYLKEKKLGNKKMRYLAVYLMR